MLLIGNRILNATLLATLIIRDIFATNDKLTLLMCCFLIYFLGSSIRIYPERESD